MSASVVIIALCVVIVAQTFILFLQYDSRKNSPPPGETILPKENKKTQTVKYARGYKRALIRWRNGGRGGDNT